MKRKNRVIAVFLCLLLFMTVGNEAKATVNNRIRIIDLSKNDITVSVDMEKQQRGNELSCFAGLFKGDGVIVSSFSTTTLAVASEIGVKDYVFQEKGFLFWNTLFSDDFCEYNTEIFSMGIEYLYPEEGKTYRTIGTHYAIINGTEYTYVMISEEVTY